MPAGPKTENLVGAAPSYACLPQPSHMSVDAAAVHVLAPPYSEPTKVVSGYEKPRLPIGSLLCVESRDKADTLCTLAYQLAAYPWAIPCAMTTANAAALLQVSHMIPAFLGRLCVAKVASTQGSFSSAAVVEACRRRGLPSPAVMAYYVARRLRVPWILELLTEQFSLGVTCSSVGATRSVATYSRAFSRLGAFTARDWRSLARLAHGLCSYRNETTSPTKAVSCQTMVRYAHKYLGLSWGTAACRVGWESVIEQALRRSGYVDEVR